MKLKLRRVLSAPRATHTTATTAAAINESLVVHWPGEDPRTCVVLGSSGVSNTIRGRGRVVQVGRTHAEISLNY